MYEPLFTLGSFSVTRFSLMACAGCLFAVIVVLMLGKQRKIKEGTLWTLIPLSLFLAVLFGHMLFAATQLLIDPYAYEDAPFLFLINPSAGGFMFLGSLLGVILACFLCAGKEKERFRELLRIVLPAAFLALAIIRLGEPLDGQGKGPEVTGGFFPLSYAPEADYPEDRYVPTFFYEWLYAMGLTVIGVLSARDKTKWDKRPVFLLILYLFGQMFFEMLREDEYVHYASLITFVRLNQLFSVIWLGMILIGDTVKLVKAKQGKLARMPWIVFALCTAACVGLEFLFDKPIPLFGQNIYFPAWLVYVLIAATAVGDGFAVLKASARAKKIA